MQLNEVNILKSTNEYNRKIVSKSGFKMDLYPALIVWLLTNNPIDQMCSVQKS